MDNFHLDLTQGIVMPFAKDNKYFKRVSNLSAFTRDQQYINTSWELRLLFQGIKPYILRLGRCGSTEYWSSLSTEISLLGPNFGFALSCRSAK